MLKIYRQELVERFGEKEVLEIDKLRQKKVLYDETWYKGTISHYSARVKELLVEKICRA